MSKSINLTRKTIALVLVMCISFTLLTSIVHAAETVVDNAILSQLRYRVVAPHTGYSGPKFGVCSHINVILYRGSSWDNKEETLSNLHIVKYTSGDQDCLYIYDTTNSYTVYDSCSDDDWSTQVNTAMASIRDWWGYFVNAIEYLALIFALAAIATAIIAALPLVPVLLL